MPVIIHAEDRGNPARLASGPSGVWELGLVCSESFHVGQLNSPDPVFRGPRSGSRLLGPVLQHNEARACTSLSKPVAPAFISLEEQHLQMHDGIVKEVDCQLK